MGGRGRSYVYELAYNSEGEDGAPFLMGLIDVESLKKSAKNNSYDAKKAGQKTELAGHGRGEVGPKSGGGRASKNGVKASDSGELVTLPPKPLQESNIEPAIADASYAQARA